MKNIGGHTSLTILNSCSFQRYRLLTPIHYKVLPGKNLLLFAKSSKHVREVESRHFWLFFRPKVLFIMSGMTYVRSILILHNLSQMSKSNILACLIHRILNFYVKSSLNTSLCSSGKFVVRIVNAPEWSKNVRMKWSPGIFRTNVHESKRWLL